MKTYTHIARAVMTRPWAIDRNSPEWAAIKDVLEHRVSGHPFSEEEIDQRLKAAVRPRSAVIGDESEERRIAILPIYGVLMPRSNLLIEMSGGASVAQLSAAFDESLRDETVAAIILDIDSPGGSVAGIPEFAAQIYAGRAVKPISAISDTMAASAAYWLGSQATDFSITPSGWVGSIGVFTEHENWEKFWADFGMDHTFIQYGENKTGGNEFEPLSDHERERMQDIVDYFGKAFDADVAKGRGVTPAAVRETFGQGDMFIATEAVQRRMVDRVETLGEAITRLSQQASRGRSVSSRADLARTVVIDASEADPEAADEAVLEAVEEAETGKPLDIELMELDAAREARERRRRRAS